ncbi:MAG: LytTR family transcriptional regulator DNA-binding domain-containing protein [Pseudomonadota bacterium]
MAKKFADITPLQFTMREMHALAQEPRFWIGFILVAIILFVSGPFGTATSMAFPERFAYWVIIAGCTFAVGLFCSLFLGEVLTGLGMGDLASRVVSGAASGFPVTAVVWFVSRYLFDRDVLQTGVELLVLAFQCVLIAASVSLIFYLLTKKPEEVQVPLRENERSLFIQRLPLHLGTDLISLQSQDHYLKVTTKKGSELLLMRMGDACQELEAVDGMQVHRSWWVSSTHVTELVKRGGKTVLKLSDGQEVPVSRGFAKTVEARYVRP